MFYKLLKWIAKIALKIFFRKIQFTTLSPIPQRSPLIVISNHPNTFMDALLIASLIDREFYFLTNASVFTNKWVKWLLKQLHMIPVFRKQDVKEGNPDNSKTFEACVQHLKNHGALIIFPEGISIGKRQLKKFKTGTARIAFQAEESNNFQLNLMILPVGINYTEPENFRSNVLIITGKPIIVKNFQERYLQNPQAEVYHLTETIFRSVQELVMDVQNDSDDELIKNIQTLIVNQLELKSPTHYSIFTIEKEIQKAIEYFSTANPYEFHDLTKEIKAYFYSVQKLELEDKTIANAKKLKKFYRKSLLEFSFLAILSPLFVIGWFTNWVPYTLPKLIAYQLTPYKEYHAGIKLVTGLIAFPLWYFLSYLWIAFLFHQKVQSLLIFVLFPLLGFFALHFAHYWTEVQKKLKLVDEFQKNKRKIGDLIIQRKKIIKKLLKLQTEYQKINHE